MERRIGPTIKCLSNQLMRMFSNIPEIMELDELTGTNGYIIHYLAKAKNDVYQKDIEKRFEITRGTASKVLSLMEQKGLIERISVKEDARLKKIVLTDKGINIALKVDEAIKAFDNSIENNITPEELEIFFRVCGKIYDNTRK